MTPAGELCETGKKWQADRDEPTLSPASMSRAPLPSVSPIRAGALAGFCLLVVDDDEINGQLARNILQRAGARVAVAGGGRAAVAILERQPRRFDAVIMDLRMPDMDGCEAARIIRTRLDLPALPIVAMSAGDRESERESASRAGMGAHVTKPIDPDVLVAVVKAQVGIPKESGMPPASRDPVPVGENPPSLPADLPGIDLRSALARLGGNDRLWVSLMRQFDASHGGAPAEVRRLLDAGLDDQAAGTLHGLRGVAANLGAIEVARLADEVETAIRDRRKADLSSLLPSLQDAMSALCGLARSLPEPARVYSTVGDADLRQSLEKLRDFLLGNNLKAIAAFESLRPVLPGRVASELIQRLTAAIETLNFADAEKLVINIMEDMNKGTQA